MITIGSSDIKESTKLQLAITLKKRELLNINKDIKQLKEERKVIQTSLNKTRTKENTSQRERLTEQIEQITSEIKGKTLKINNILKGIHKRFIRLQNIKRAGCNNREN